MKSINLHIIKGTIGRDARISTIGERKVANFAVATEYDYKNKDGSWNKETTWHNICAWQGFGVCDLSLLKKGVNVYITGRHRTRKYTDSQGLESVVEELLAETVDIVAPDKAEKSQKDGGKPRTNNPYPTSEEDF